MRTRILATLADRRDALWLARAIGMEYGIRPELETVDRDRHAVVASVPKQQELHVAGFVRGFLFASGIQQTEERKRK